MADSTKNYVATYSDMKTVADAIRSKTGESGALTFPNGWKTAIENIETGSAELNYSELVSGSTVLTAGKTYSFKMENKRFNNTSIGDGNVFFGATQDTRNNLTIATATSLANNKLFSTKTYTVSGVTWATKPTIAADAAGKIMFKLGTAQGGGTGSWYESQLLTYGLKLSVPKFSFSIMLGSHSIPASAASPTYNTGFSFFLCDRLQHPMISANTMYLSDSAISTTSYSGGSTAYTTAGTFKTTIGRLLFFTFTPVRGSANTWQLYSSFRNEGSTTTFVPLYSVQTYKSNTNLKISFDEQMRVLVNDELVRWNNTDAGGPYVQTIGRAGVTDYNSQAYFGWVITQYGGTNYTAILNSCTYGELTCPATCFTQGWTVTGTSNPKPAAAGIVNNANIPFGTIPYTNRTTDALGNTWTSGSQIAIKPSSINTPLYITLASTDISKFWGQTMLFDENAYLIKEGSQWYLYNNMLDGTKTRFAVTLSAEPNTSTWCAGDLVKGTVKSYTNVTTKVEAKIPASAAANPSLVLMDYKLTDYDLVENPRAVGEVRIETDALRRATVIKTVEDGFACPDKVYYALVD